MTITWSVEYYDDCGFNGHSGDIESFAVAIHPLAPPDTSPSGYGAYSMTTVAHWGATEDYEWGWLCEHWDTETYLPYKGDLGHTEGPRFFPFWEEVYIADDKHSTYLTDFDCDAGCFFLGDECAPQFVVNVEEPPECRDDSPEDLFVFPENCGQQFFMFNVGEANDRLIETFQELNDAYGLTFRSGSIWTWGRTPRRFLSSPADGISLDPGLDLYLVFPSTVRPGQDVSVDFDLQDRSPVWARVYTAIGGIRQTTPILLGEFCPGQGIQARAWNGLDNDGFVLGPGLYILRLSSAMSFWITDVPRGEAGRPFGVAATEVDGNVRLTWGDNATDEEQFVVERITESLDGVFTCGFRTIAYLDSSRGTGDVAYVDDDFPHGESLRYRVYATNGGGHSSLSGEVAITRAAVPPVNLTVDCRNPDDPRTTTCAVGPSTRPARRASSATSWSVGTFGRVGGSANRRSGRTGTRSRSSTTCI